MCGVDREPRFGARLLARARAIAEREPDADGTNVAECLEAEGELAVAEEAYARARALVEAASTRDLRRGLSYTSGVLAAAMWLTALGVLIYSAHRISGPIQRLQAIFHMGESA